MTTQIIRAVLLDMHTSMLPDKDPGLVRLTDLGHSEFAVLQSFLMSLSPKHIASKIMQFCGLSRKLDVELRVLAGRQSGLTHRHPHGQLRSM